VTFPSAICGGAPSVGLNVREPTGGTLFPHVPTCLSHGSLLYHVEAPDVACRIIHSYTHESVHLAPRAHIKPTSPPPGTIQAWGHWGESLCSPVSVALARYRSVRYCCVLPLLRLQKEGPAKVAHSWESLGCDREVKRREELSGISPAELTASGAEPSEEDLFTLAVARAHADNSKAPAWQERHRHYSPASQPAMFIQPKEKIFFFFYISRFPFADRENMYWLNWDRTWKRLIRSRGSPPFFNSPHGKVSLTAQ